MNKKHKNRFALVAMTLIVGLMGAMLLVGTAVAAEDDPYSNDGPRILPSVIERGEPNRPDVIDDRDRREDSSKRGPLPFTGADLTLFVATGLAAVATGSVIVRRTRSRSLQ